MRHSFKAINGLFWSFTFAVVTAVLFMGPGGAGAQTTLGGGLVVEPFVGEIDFAEELFLQKQKLAGVRAGINLASSWGLVGYYWRGVNDDYDDFVDIESWGGELHLNIPIGTAFEPYVVAGAGRLSFRDEYLDVDNRERDDQNLRLPARASRWPSPTPFA